MNKIKCDSCGFTFDISKIKLVKRKIRDDIEQTFFVCPKCKNKYVVMTTDTAVRKLIKKRKALSGFAKECNKDEFIKKMNEYNVLGKEIKAKLNKLAVNAERW